jgi:hypothetical protein
MAALRKFFLLMTLNDEALIALEQDFIAKHAPTSELEALRPTIVRFYLQGLSKLLTFRFLQSAGLVSCSQRTFFRWVAKSMNLPAESQAYLDAQAEKRAAPAKSAQQESASATAATDPSAEALQGQGAATLQPVGEAAVAGNPAEQEAADAKAGGDGMAAGDRSSDSKAEKTTLSTTQKTPVKSTYDKGKVSADERRRLVTLLDEQLAEMERNTLGAVSDRALARLNQRDIDRSGRGG